MTESFKLPAKRRKSNIGYTKLITLILSIMFFFSIFNLFGINFQDINLSNDDRLIFRTDFEDQHAIFVSQLTDMSMRQLTAYPEKMYLVNNGRTILSIGRFGAMRIPAEGGLPSAIPGYPSFSNGDLPLRGRLQDLSASSDGRWVLFIEPVSSGYGRLVMIDMSNGSRRLISERIELPASDFPVKWSPDSRFFVYAKGGRLFYFPILSNLSAITDERFRMIGPGTINSVSWGKQGDFYYLTGNTLYNVINPELFTRAMYGDFLSIGNSKAVLPISFDSNFDRYWIAPDSGSILMNKGEKGFFLFLLGENQTILPHITLPPVTENFNVIWSTSGLLTVLYSEKNETKIWRFEITKNSVRTINTENIPLSALGALSPNETKAVFWGTKGLELWDYTEWRRISRISDTPVLSCIWVNNTHFISGNPRFIEEVNTSLSSYPRRRICLSGADEIGFEDATTSRILARIGTTWYATNGSSSWTAVNNIRVRQISFSSDKFRVFLEPQSQGHFQNTLMIRNLQSFATSSLTARHKANNVFTQEITGEEPRLRLPGRPMQIALCFDLYDDDTGLAQVLTALRRYNIRATFFLNGEFIRRNPQATNAIVEAGHEAASLFYAPIDFSDTRYRITEGFISQGLARNEDEFNKITGRELTIIWHPPFYRSTALINSAAAAAGYLTAVRSFDPGDWLSKEDSLRLNMRQIPPSEMIEQIMSNRQHGAVIPIRLGLLPGGRDEYLFQYIEVLLDALIRSGCEIVTVSSVIRR